MSKKQDRLKKDIKKLEEDIKNAKTKNQKVKALRGLKYSLRFLQLIAPYAVATGIGLGTLHALGITPFIRDEHKKYLESENQFDSLGNVRYEEQYESYENPVATITYYGEWKKDDNGLHKREIKKYAAKKIDEETIKEIVTNKEIASLEEILGNPIAIKEEKKNNLTEDELNEKAFLQATTYSKDKDDFILVKESVSDNIKLSIVSIALLVLIEFGISVCRRDYSSFNFGDSISDIKDRHRLIDTNEMIEQLENKKNEILDLEKQKIKK